MAKEKQQVDTCGKKVFKIITNYTKQIELIKAQDITERINIIGCGALGSWIVFILLKMGFSNIHVYDFDTIEEHNIPNQLFKESQIGELKVKALDLIYKDFFNEEPDEERVSVYAKKVDEDNCQFGGVTLCCVDTMAGRKELFESMFKYGNAKLWIEGRIGLYGAYIYTLTEKEKIQLDNYEETLYNDSEAEVSSCGVSQTALPSAINCASIMVMQLIEHFNGSSPLNKIEYSIPWLTNMVSEWK